MGKHTAASYDTMAERYAELQEAKQWVVAFERPAVLGFLPDVNGRDVLDAGCGPGFYSEYLVNHGARVTAFDYQPFFVERTRRVTAGRATVFRADLAEPLSSVPDRSIDVVICILVLHYLEEWLPALREFYRVLRDGGELVISTHHPFTDLELSPTGNYFATDLVEDEWDVGKVRFFRRPLSRITGDLVRSRFTIAELAEPRPEPEPSDPLRSSFDFAMNNPTRLMVRALKQPVWQSETERA